MIPANQNETVETISNLASRLKIDIENIRALGAEAFLRGDLESISRELERLKWSTETLALMDDLSARLPELGAALAAPIPPSASVPQIQLTVETAKAPVALAVPTPATPSVAVPEQESAKPVSSSVVVQPQAINLMEEALAPFEKPAKKKRPDKARYVQARRAWMKTIKELIDAESWLPGQEAEAKAAVCEGRMLMSDAAYYGEVDQDVEEELDYFRRQFDVRARIATFFGFNLQRSFTVAQWKDLQRAYRLLSVALQVMDWLGDGRQLDAEDTKQLLQYSAACEAMLFRSIDDMVVGVVDEQQRRLNSRIRDMVAEQFYVPYWNLDPDKRIPTDQVLADANKLEGVFDRVRELVARRDLREPAAKKLTEILGKDQLTDDFESELQSAVATLLESGVQPSDKSLRLSLMPYRGYLESSPSRMVQRLVEYIRSDATITVTKGKTIVDNDAEESASDEALQSVREAIKGKNVLFIGGNKGQLWRKNDYKETLGIKDLVWPDFEEHTRPESMSAHISNADVVCLLIRWSRHSYKGLLDQAKQQGKECVTLARGVGLKTFVKAYEEQILVGKRD